MGNRAVIAFTTETMPAPPHSVGVYLHWNGGPESVQAFVDVLRDHGFRSPGADMSYAIASFTGLAFAFFDASGLSLGVGPLDQLDCDNWDNGMYIVGPRWEILRRKYVPSLDRSRTETLRNLPWTGEDAERVRQTKHYKGMYQHLCELVEEMRAKEAA